MRCLREYIGGCIREWNTAPAPGDREGTGKEVPYARMRRQPPRSAGMARVAVAMTAICRMNGIQQGA